MQTRAQLNAATTEALTEVQFHRGSTLYMAFIALLDSVDAQHLETLAAAKPDAVEKVQGALAQVRALRKALVTTGANSSPIG
ncbi:hypothetical protein [Massilia sp. TSP1-1-2]|uniref:hypothetical protein n=1 Tax=Massilia sp. TSP1-1-2 TaxID=2804649 RepID=UPI003CE99683